MKKITLLFILCLTFVSWSYGQCTNQTYQWPQTTITIDPVPGPQTISTNNYPQNEFSIVDGLVIGESYTVTASGTTYVTVTEDDRVTILASGMNTASFVATTTEIACFWTADAACNNGPSTNTLTQIECTTCTCSSTSPTVAATNPLPLDAATGVEIIYSGADTLIDFDWDDTNAGTDVGTTYTFYLGTNAAGDNIGNLPVDDTDVLLNYSWAENTQYFWKIDINNCAGTITSPVWSFTTFTCAATVPNAVTSIVSPTNGATNVDIDETDPNNLFITFDWNAPATGDPATNYTLSFGDNPLAENIGTLQNLDTDVDVNYTWQYDTTYYWKITAQNCAGTSATSASFSFTTETNPLSVEDFQRNSVKHYYDINTDVLTLTSETSELSNVLLYNILGQQVMDLHLSDTTANINLSSLKDGVYIAKVSISDRTQTIKVLKQ